MSVREIVMGLSGRAGTPTNKVINHAVCVGGRGSLLNPVTVDSGTPVAHIDSHRAVRRACQSRREIAADLGVRAPTERTLRAGRDPFGRAVDEILMQDEPRTAALRRQGVAPCS